jgi:hypothetical protein
MCVDLAEQLRETLKPTLDLSQNWLVHTLIEGLGTARRRSRAIRSLTIL